MKIGFFQFSPHFGEIEYNVNKAVSYISKEEVDLMVLPELFNTGYLFASAKEALDMAELVPEGYTTRELMKIAKKRNAFIVAGLAEKESDNCYNSAVLVGPDGFIGRYRKVHLFDKEKFCFIAGNLGFPVFDIGNNKIGIMICFDWIFPEVARILALKGAEIICHPANLVLPFCQDAMITRAIENRVFCITANRIGVEKRNSHEEIKFTGASQIVDAKGEVLHRMSEEEGIRVVSIDPARAQNKYLTKNNDIFGDRQEGTYFTEHLNEKNDEKRFVLPKRNR